MFNGLFLIGLDTGRKNSSFQSFFFIQGTVHFNKLRFWREFVTTKKSTLQEKRYPNVLDVAASTVKATATSGN